ncbi:hypothetical protein FRC10_010170 [Ceratobasidium sp. 414]|nr:hypothetical protein FRC10_010170 [Ceratobasidium sp. 414]
MAGAIIESSEHANRDPSPKLPPATSIVDQPPNEAPAATATAPVAPEPGLPAGDKPPPLPASAVDPPSDANDLSDPVFPVVLDLPPSPPRNTPLKRSGSGLRLATVGTSKVSRHPLSRLNRPPKIQHLLQPSSSLSSELDGANTILDTEPPAPSVQPQISSATPSGAKEPVVSSATKATGSSLYGPKKLARSKVKLFTNPKLNRGLKGSTSRSGAAHTNGHLTGDMTALTKSAVDTPSSTGPAPSTNTPSALPNPTEKTVAPSISPSDGNPNTTIPDPALSHCSSPPPAGPQAAASTCTTDSLPNESNSHTPRDEIPATQAPDSLTQNSIASTPKSTPPSSNGSVSVPPIQTSTAPKPNPPKVNVVRFRFPVETSQKSNEKPRSHSNGIAKPRPLVVSSSSSTFSSLSSSQPPSPPLPEVLPEPSKSGQQWEKDDQYIIDYMNWTFEQDPRASTTEIMLEIARRLPHHSVEAWQRRFTSHEGSKFIHHVPVLNKRFHKRTSSIGSKGKSKSQAVTPARPSPPTSPAELAAPPPPPLPPTYTDEEKATNDWTEGEEQFLVDYMNWYFQQWPDAPTDDILIDIATMVPRHNRQKWFAHFRKREDMHYMPKVPELFRRMTNRTSRVNPSGSWVDTPTVARQAMDAAQKRKRNEVDYTISSDEGERKSWRNRSKGGGSSTGRKSSRLKRPRNTL